MDIYEKLHLETYINNQYFWLKNNTAQLERESRTRLFPVYLRMTDIHRFSNRKWVLMQLPASNKGGSRKKRRKYSSIEDREQEDYSLKNRQEKI